MDRWRFLTDAAFPLAGPGFGMGFGIVHGYLPTVT